VCEGSDWFWWAGDAGGRGETELGLLFQQHLRKLYDALGAASPDFPTLRAGADADGQSRVIRPSRAV
jgi:alpha-amylase/alpha-mannosidase (GH57 family)